MKVVVLNHVKEIEKVLKLDEGSCKHEYNFHFSATQNGQKVIIHAESIDDDEEYINIYSVDI